MTLPRAAALLPLAFLPAVAAAGCSSDDDTYTDHYAINQLNGSYGAFADEANLRILAAFLGDGGFLKLRSGDAVEIDVNGQRAAHTLRELDDKIHYVVDLAPPREETDVTITFVRGTERVVNKVKIPAAFELVKVPSAAKFLERVDVDVDPRPDLSKWPGFFGTGLIAKAEISAPCLEGGSQKIDLCGADSPADKCVQGYPLRIDLGKLLFVPNTTTCELSVQLRLSSGGGKWEGIGPKQEAFKGGGFEAYRAKSFKLTVNQ